MKNELNDCAVCTHPLSHNMYTHAAGKACGDMRWDAMEKFEIFAPIHIKLNWIFSRVQNKNSNC